MRSLPSAWLFFLNLDVISLSGIRRLRWYCPGEVVEAVGICQRRVIDAHVWLYGCGVWSRLVQCLGFAEADGQIEGLRRLQEFVEHQQKFRTDDVISVRNLDQEPITCLHLPYKPLESTLSDEKLFIEIAFAEYFSRLLSNIQSEQSYDHTSHAESQKRDLNCCQQWR